MNINRKPKPKNPKQNVVWGFTRVVKFRLVPACWNARRARRNSTTGFTIVEMIIYVSVLALILVGVVQMILAVSSTFNELRATRQLNRSAVVLLDRFVREVRDAESVVVDSSVFDTHPGELTISVEGTNVRFYVDGGVVKLDRGGAYEGDLTVPDVSATSFVFRRSTPGSISETIRLEVTLESISGSGSAIETFYTTAVMRGPYGQ